MKLYDLLENKIQTKVPDCDVLGITDDSRKVQKGWLFVCARGEKFNGHEFAGKALENGAAAIVTDHDLGLEKQIIVENTRKFYGELCASWFNHPERRLKLIGVTGTNGKTTTTKLIKEILTKCGHKTGLIGTIQNEIGDEIIKTENTTPMAFEFMELLDRMVKSGCDCAVMEVSSFALVQHRIGPAHFRIAVFTNLTQDHLDYHGTMEEYYKAKRMLFNICDLALINTDDEYGKRIFEETSCDKYSLSTHGKADFYAENIALSPSGTNYDFCLYGESIPVFVPIPGNFNVFNSLAAMSACIKLGIPKEKVISAMTSCRGVKGRCEVIPTGKDFTVICDYAHTPDAIENILSSVKGYTKGRLICLFGCGGNRDRTKRPKMAKAAAKYADMLIITSDNPRDEKPGDIINDILEGLNDANVPYEVVEDRKEAIFFALKTAKKDDVIVLAGKGHEDYQILAGNEHIHFDEREIVAQGLKLL